MSSVSANGLHSAGSIVITAINSAQGASGVQVAQAQAAGDIRVRSIQGMAPDQDTMAQLITRFFSNAPIAEANPPKTKRAKPTRVEVEASTNSAALTQMATKTILVGTVTITAHSSSARLKGNLGVGVETNNGRTILHYLDQKHCLEQPGNYQVYIIDGQLKTTILSSM